MITFMDTKEKSEEVERCLDPQLWFACAGGMVQMPALNTKVFYFPQGHAEHASGPVDFRNCPKVSSMVLCRVTSIKYMADPETDEVYAKLRLLPLSETQYTRYDDHCDFVGGINGSENQEKPTHFAKTLTQSDANNGGGFSVPRFCAETIFPRLDYSKDPPVHNIFVKDVHGEIWKFRHIYRGTPRRHLLTTGWSTFVNHKKLVAGDSIVFLRAENGELRIGIRRGKKGIGGGHEDSTGWNSGGGNCSLSWSEQNDNNMLRTNGSNLNPNANMMGKVKVRPEAVVEAVNLAANKKPFEVVYFPRASAPQFCVKESLVEDSLKIEWCSGLRFKMAFETEDSSRISWFMGIVSLVQPADPLVWPNSPWRCLQVKWDEPEILHNVRRVSPWLAELAANIPDFPSPQKKLRLPQHPDFPIDLPTYPGNLLGPSNPYGYLTESTPAGMQGARHAHYDIPPILDPSFSKFQSDLIQAGLLLHNHAATPPSVSHNLTLQNPSTSENVSCLLSMASSTPSSKKLEDEKPPELVLFGQKILTEEQMSKSSSGDTVSPVLTGNCSSDGNADKATNISDGSGSALHQKGLRKRLSWESFQCYKDNRQEADASLKTGDCKVFMESEEVGRTIDLSLLGSYDELYRKLADMYIIEKSEMPNRVLYEDITGALKHFGDEPFSNFTRTARRLTIMMDDSSNNIVGV